MKPSKSRIDALVKIWSDTDGVVCTYDQIMADVKAARIKLRVERPERKKSDKIRYIPHDQFQLALSCVDDAFSRKRTQSLMGMWLTLQEATGVRINECSLIELENIDLKQRTIRLVATKGEKVRSVIFSVECGNQLAQFMRALPATQKYLFEKQKRGLPDGPYSTRAIQKNFKRLRDYVTHHHGVDLSFLTSHVLRHTHLTDMAGADLNSNFLQDQSGHESFETTQKVYIHNNIQLRREAHDTANNVLAVQRQGRRVSA